MQAEFDALGVTVVGVSFDSPKKNQAWAEKEAFPFQLWSDTERVLAKAYGAKGWLPVASRRTVLLDANGALVLRYDDVDVPTHAQDVLDDCRRLFAEG